MKIFTLTLALFFGVNLYAQDPQTNDPDMVYPLLNEFIKEGYDRNYRTHTKKLRTIDFIYLIDIPYANPKSYIWKRGDQQTYSVYSYRGKSEHRKVIAINVIWYNNYLVLRRMFFKSIGIAYGLDECHKECRHIMSQRTLMDPVLVFYDAVPEEWSKELDLFYNQLSKLKI
jgi:hypothetical protein